MGILRCFCLGACVLFALPAASRADRVRLKDGKTLTGIITKEEDILLILLTEQGEQVIDRNQISDRQKDPPDVNELIRSNIQLRQENQQLRKGVTVPSVERLPESNQPSALAEVQAGLKRLEARLEEISSRLGALQATLAALPAPSLPGNPATAANPTPMGVPGPLPAGKRPNEPLVKVVRSNCYFYTPPPPAQPFFSVNGEIQNVGGVPAKNIVITIFFKDPKGGIIDSKREEMMKGRTLRPNGKCPFMISPDASRMSRPPVDKGEDPKYEIEIESEPAPEAEAPSPGASPPASPS